MDGTPAIPSIIAAYSDNLPGKYLRKVCTGEDYRDSRASFDAWMMKKISISSGSKLRYLLRRQEKIRTIREKEDMAFSLVEDKAEEFYNSLVIQVDEIKEDASILISKNEYYDDD